MKEIILKMMRRMVKVLFEDIMLELDYIKSENIRLQKKLNESISNDKLLRHYIVALQSDFSRYHAAWQRSVIFDGNKIHFNQLKMIYDLFPVCEINLPLALIGNIRDGGYVMVDDFTNKKIAYSFGICDDVTWELGIISVGISHVYMYDHTIASLPEENVAFHWKKCGIIGVFDNSKPELNTLEHFLLENKHECESELILKMDVEGAEWDVLQNTPSRIWDKFSQITLEMHWILDDSNYSKIISALQNINKTHIPIHVHGNNNRGYEIMEKYVMPDVLEVTYVNIREYKEYLVYKKIEFPLGIDYRNNPERSEIFLGTWGKD